MSRVRRPLPIDVWCPACGAAPWTKCDGDEIAKARALAETATEAECQAELDRLETTRNSHLEAWRYTQ